MEARLDSQSEAIMPSSKGPRNPEHITPKSYTAPSLGRTCVHVWRADGSNQDGHEIRTA